MEMVFGIGQLSSLNWFRQMGPIRMPFSRDSGRMGLAEAVGAAVEVVEGLAPSMPSRKESNSDGIETRTRNLA